MGHEPHKKSPCGDVAEPSALRGPWLTQTPGLWISEINLAFEIDKAILSKMSTTP